MTNTPAGAIKKANSITTGYVRLCLKFVRTCYGIPAKELTAALAWKNAHQKHKTSRPTDAPAGAPVFFYTPATTAGHVAVHLGGGKFRTNYSARGTVVTAKMGKTGPLAGMKMLGWTEDINGVTIPGLGSGGHSASEVSRSTYTVKRGDTLSAIAVKHHTTVSRLAAVNGIKNPNIIHPGQVLTIK